MKANKKYACETCSTFFSHQSSYCRHKKKCQTEKTQIIQPSNIITTELVMELIKDNKELKEIILEQNNTINNLVKNGITNNSINNATNSLNNNNNKTFNLQIFLNETCKDAMNIMDFIESIKLQLSDLEKVGEVGYTQGISNIITTNLKALDVTQRPVHCTDKKRETMYIKDEDKWEKEDENKTKLRKVIKRVANKNIKLLPKFRENNPGYDDAESTISDKYSKMVIEAMGGSGNNDLEKEDKIIHNISKCVVIDKYIEA
jgi:plasmid maintenance system antidote protein VapI